MSGRRLPNEEIIELAARRGFYLGPSIYYSMETLSTSSEMPLIRYLLVFLTAANVTIRDNKIRKEAIGKMAATASEI